ncbi:GNAT family N-acetyltransferase [Vicingaceae bacterium]|nr:GNAT family N-acetyltransferase [Vicingaceae bacterium]MDB4060845.1 GNAT family N-acetyltransferase [Vicingaceae bacterium]
MEDIKIRKVLREDNFSLAKIIRAAFIEFGAPLTGTVYEDPNTDALFELFDSEKMATLYVAEKDGEVLGCCGVFPTKGLDSGYAELVKFYLAKGARNRGIGKALFEKSILVARDFDYKYLYIESQPSFSKAVKMYEQYGFNYLNHSLGDSGHGNCDVWMLKTL